MDYEKLGKRFIKEGQEWLGMGHFETGLDFIKTGALLIIGDILQTSLPGGIIDPNERHTGERVIIPFDFSLKEDRNALIGKMVEDVDKNVLKVTRIGKRDGKWCIRLGTCVLCSETDLFKCYRFADTGKPVGKVVEE